MRHVAPLSLVIGLLSATLTAHASTVQLTSASQLSSSDSKVTFPTVHLATEVSGPQAYSAGGNTLTFTNTTNHFEEDTVGLTYATSGFPGGTNILFSSGFNGADAPVTVSFSQAVTEFGFNAEEFAAGNEVFTLNVFDGTMLVGTFTATGNDPSTLAFLGVDAAGGTMITSFTIADADGNNIALGPITFGGSATATPEPSTLALLGTSLLGAARLVQRRRRVAHP